MQSWLPSPAPEDRRFRVEVNVRTGRRTERELTLDEYRARHVAKLTEWNRRDAEAEATARKARRQALLDRLLDEMEAKETP
jgi:hypothetical protein